MITIDDDRLKFRFPEVHEEAQCSIDFQRTLRIPDDGKTYPLPLGLGRFPMRHLDDYARNLPEAWLPRGGVIAPMWQAEAMWIKFNYYGYPFAMKVATGKICAITGDQWVNHLNQGPQDYAVLPGQLWLDGYCAEKGTIRQFVAMPLGEGYSAEEQLTGKAEHGGIQVAVYPIKAEHYEEEKRSRQRLAELIAERDGDLAKVFKEDEELGALLLGAALAEDQRQVQEQFAEDDGALADLRSGKCAMGPSDIGLAPGGRIEQEIYEDHYGLDAWDRRYCSRCFVSIANSKTWMAITGEPPPLKPPSAADYTAAGLPWFDYYGGDAKALEGAEALGKLTSVQALGKAKKESPLPENESVDPRAMRLVKLGRERPEQPVREMTD